MGEKRGAYLLENRNIVRRIILRCIFRKWNGGLGMD